MWAEAGSGDPCEDNPVADAPNPPARGVTRLWGFSAVRYLVVGAFSFAFDVGLLALLHNVFGIALPVSTPVAFLLSFLVTFSLQRSLAFRSTDGVAPSMLRYTSLVAANAVATTLIVALADASGLPWLVGKIAAVVCTTIWNYFAYRNWIFADRSTVED